MASVSWSILDNVTGASCRTMTFSIDDIRAAESISPLQTFQVQGKTLFIDEATFENKYLLSLLLPADPLAVHVQEAADGQTSDDVPANEKGDSKTGSKHRVAATKSECDQGST
jgi:hypothetical protein